jgi:zinc transporter 9
MALAGNTFVTIIKLIAFVLSGSGAMLSEAIHSGADTGNQLLLFIGLKRGERQPDDRFHYGYGGERFVFGMLSAAGIFFIGCGITVYHGVESLISPHAPQLSTITLVVLAVAFLIEGGVLLFAVRSVTEQRGTTPFFQFLRESADPATVAILLEDGAAVLGLLVACAGIGLTYATGSPLWDSLGSIVVGVVLGFVAIYLVRENRELLLGRAVPDGVEDRFVAILTRHPAVRALRDVKTHQLTPEAFKFKAEVTFNHEYLAARLSRALPSDLALEGAARDAGLRTVAALTTELIAAEIASIERAVRAEIPQARHIDLEVSPVAPVDDRAAAPASSGSAAS